MTNTLDADDRDELADLRSERLQRLRDVPLPMFPDPVLPTAVADAVRSTRPVDD